MLMFRDWVRIELVCGGRAFRYLNRALEQNVQVSRLLSAKLFETGKAAERLLAENEALKAQNRTREEEHFLNLASQYAGAGDVVLFASELSSDSLRRLCDAVLHACGGRCACFSQIDSGGYKYAIGQQNGDLRALVRDVNQTLNGRGGGKPDFVQGSVQASREEIEGFFRNRGPEG